MTIILGRVLWWCKSQENGVIFDSSGNEYYFDLTVTKLKNKQAFKRNGIVLFISERVDGSLTASYVEIPLYKLKYNYEKMFENSKTQLSFSF